MNASVPVAVVALRGITNARGEFLITTLPVADLTARLQRIPVSSFRISWTEAGGSLRSRW